MNDAVTPKELELLLQAGEGILVLDVRKIKDRVEVSHPVPTAEWRNPEQVAEWCTVMDAAKEIIVFCVHGHQVSQSTRDALRARGFRSRIVEGGIDGWCRYKQEVGADCIGE